MKTTTLELNEVEAQMLIALVFLGTSVVLNMPQEMSVIKASKEFATSLEKRSKSLSYKLKDLESFSNYFDTIGKWMETNPSFATPTLIDTIIKEAMKNVQ